MSTARHRYAVSMLGILLAAPVVPGCQSASPTESSDTTTSTGSTGRPTTSGGASSGASTGPGSSSGSSSGSAADSSTSTESSTGSSTGSPDAVPCNTLFAARLAADNDLDSCDVDVLGSGIPTGCESLTPNDCAELLFEAPETGAATSTHNQFIAQLPRCVSGTNDCRPEARMRCADGTRGFVYVDKAVDALGNDIESDDWLFFGDASGANCDSDATCSDRYGMLGTNGMTSFRANRSHDGHGVLDDAPANPFHDFNRVFVQRCTADSLAGRGAPVTSITGPSHTYEAPIFHHGALGYELVFRTLAVPGGLPHTEEDGDKVLPDFSNANRVVLVGFSGSSRGLAHNADAFAEVVGDLTDANATVKLVFDAAFSPSLDNELHWDETGAVVPGNSLYERNRPFPDARNPLQMEPDADGPGEDAISSRSFENGGATREGLVWWGAQEDASCVGEHGADYLWECAEREHVIANHITTDTFVAHRLYDTSEVGSPTGVPVHGWMHSRAACAADPTVENCYDWNDDDYRDRSRFQIETMMTRHFLDGEEAPYVGSYGAFATEGSGHEGLIDATNFQAPLGRCDGGALVPGTTISLVEAVRGFVDDTLPTPYWSAVAGRPHPGGGVWSSPGSCL